MKVRVTLKDPDTMHDAVEEAVKRAIEEDAGCASLSKKEREYILDERIDPVQSAIIERWMPYGEYLTVEFDTEAGTASVIPAKEFK